jgi:hypothetical protein
MLTFFAAEADAADLLAVALCVVFFVAADDVRRGAVAESCDDCCADSGAARHSPAAARAAS